MGDFSRDTFDPTKNYNKVLAQQNHALLDAEYNELQDIIKHRNKNITKSIFGTGAIGDGYLVKSTGVNNTIRIKSGMFINQGDYVHLLEDYTLSGLTTPAIGGVRIDVVYADYYNEEIDSSADTNLKDPVLNVETCIRYKTKIEIKIQEGTVVGVTPALPAVLTGHNVFIIAYLARLDADPTITDIMIQDMRNAQAACFVEYGLEVTKDTGFVYDWTAGAAYVGGSRYIITSGSGNVPSSNTSYVYIDQVGVVQDALALPPEFHVPLAKIVADATEIISIEDLRTFMPAMMAPPIGSLVPVIATALQEIKPVASGVNKFDVVYVSGDNVFDQANATIISTALAKAILVTDRDVHGNATLLFKGTVFNAAWAGSWNANDTLYLDTANGDITDDISAFVNNNVVQRIGTVLDGTVGVIIFNPSEELIVL